MPVTKPSQLHGHTVHPVGVDPAIELSSITRQTINTGTEVIRESSAGSIYPEIAYIVAQRPGVSFSTLNLAQILDVLDLRGLCITTDGGAHPGYRAYARRKSCAGPAGGSVHNRYTFGNGVLFINNISVDHQGNALTNVQFVSGYDGTNLPLVLQTNQAVPATPINTFRWSMAKLVIGGVSFDGKRSIDLNFGNVVPSEGADGDLYDTFVGNQSSSPTLTVRGVNPDWATSLLGGVGAHANTSVYFRKRGFADNLSEHVQISMAGLYHTEQVFDASGNDTGQTDLIINTVEDTFGNAPIFIDTTSPIPP